MLTFEKQDPVAVATAAQLTAPPATGGLPPTAPAPVPRRARRAPRRRADHWEDAARAQLAGVGITFF